MSIFTDNRHKHLLWLLMEFDINRYLMSNADGRRDGAEKAQRHLNLSYTFVASVKLCAPDEAAFRYIEDYQRVHDKTQELTNHMDEVIGFPHTGRPDYDRLAPKFFNKFIGLAKQAMEEQS